MNNYFAPCPKGMEYLLVDEIKELGGIQVHEALAGVHFEADLTTAYRVCMWTRLATRVLLPLAEGVIANADELYQLAGSIDWTDHFGADQTFAISANSRHPAFNNSQYLALRTKDAIVDQFRDRGLNRPNVERQHPDIQLYAFAGTSKAILGVDFGGRALQQRGYRQDRGSAPLRENLAAAILLRARWPSLMAEGGFVDPMCGAGTLVIEAALTAADIASGLLGAEAAAAGWLGHQAAERDQVEQEAQERRRNGAKSMSPRFFGYDIDRHVISAARANAARAGLAEWLRFEARPVAKLERSSSLPATGLLVCNPPYGEKVGEQERLFDLYRVLGDRVIEAFSGWQAAVFIADAELGHAIRLKPSKRYKLFNGSIPCLLIDFGRVTGARSGIEKGAPRALGPGAEMLANRLRKNLKKLRKYLNKNELNCYRAYDADLPEYAAAIDVYGEKLHIQEYQAPATIPVATARRRLSELLRAAQAVFECSSEQIVVKTRRRQRGSQQYERRAETDSFFVVKEGEFKFKVNLTDYLDTGLFLDHRQTRQMVREMASGTAFLNLYCYTGSLTVAAAAGGAIRSTSVDLSKKYLKWAQQNLYVNTLDSNRHTLVPADCLDWLAACTDRFDLIFVDPPTFSNSKKMDHDFDLQRDQGKLLRRCLLRLEDDGIIIFSNNFSKFKLDLDILSDCKVEEITHKTVPPDFARSKPHRCWLIRKKS
jgi:23S rRNA (guanine2445-N2)-methyltransferase / 23S rRNA (guanine2069-N7)-methyltransferase